MNAGPQTWRVAEFVRTVRWEGLPADVRSQAIRCVLDLCGAAVAGSRTQAAHSAVSYALYAHGNGPSTIIGTSATSTPVGAALANGFAASALDVDDGYRPVKGHPGAVVFPAVLAAAEEAFPERALAWVEIETMDGSRARSGVLGAWGDAGTSFRDRELTKKFRSLTDPLLGPDHAKKLLSAVHGLPESPDLGEVTSLLRLAQSRTCEGYNRAEF